MIYGNVEGIKSYIIDELMGIYDIETDKNILVDFEIMNIISIISNKINREISVAINRRGKVIEISIGDSNTASLPNINRNNNKLCGIRIIHTHPKSSSMLSEVDVSALLNLKLDAMVAIGLDGENITDISCGFCRIVDKELNYELINKISINKLLSFDFLNKIEEIEKEFRENILENEDIEKAILVGIDTEESLEELKELAIACDIKTVGHLFQKRAKEDNKYYIGKGKINELSLMRQIKDANLIIFDDELTGIQLKSIEDLLGCKVIDRTMLILEIFSRRAKTKEAKIQVLIAELKYKSARLIGHGISLSRQGGGIGSRGLGEQKLELDKRRIRETIQGLKLELEKIQKVKDLQRVKRDNSRIPKIALVGYTNVGKSTLRNLLVSEYPDDNSIEKTEVLSKNMLFATLDTTVRTFKLLDKRIVSLTDTVGFIRKLPHDLIESFKSTLSEVIHADLMLHVVDASNDNTIEQIKSVEYVLEELNSNDKPMFLVLNKCDIASEEQISNIKKEFSNYETIEISTIERHNIEELLKKIEKFLPTEEKEIVFLIPYDKTSIVSYLHSNSRVINVEHIDKGTKIKSLVNKEIEDKYKEYIL